MFLIVGLGNPGKKYQNTRHNIGFRAVDEIATNFQFTIFSFQSIFNAKISKGKIANKKIILVKPQTFMNLSGKAVKILHTKYHIPYTKLLVLHDDIDLPLGKIRIVKNRGAAGHKGVESIIKELKSKNFVRFRIGICPKTSKPKNPEKFVLQKFNKEEEKIVKEVIKKTVEAIEFSLKEGLEKAMQKYNR
jgi:PTH1 family peptidyl-tRNA hydrolase